MRVLEIGSIAIAVAMTSFFSWALISSSANATTCWLEAGWYVPWNCNDTGNRTTTGQMVYMCCA